MMSFRAPQINLYSRDLAGAIAFYLDLGFVETFRTPDTGPPAHVELTLDGFRLGIATVQAAGSEHGIRPEGEGRWIEIVLWTEDVDRAVAGMSRRGVRVLSAPHDFLGGKLRAAWVADPDGNPVQLVMRAATHSQ